VTAPVQVRARAAANIDVRSPAVTTSASAGATSPSANADIDRRQTFGSALSTFEDEVLEDMSNVTDINTSNDTGKAATIITAALFGLVGIPPSS
jgi:hypothetical protein